MSKKIQKLNVIDIECTCWQNQIAPNGNSQMSESEIIEIGIAQVDVRSLEILNKKSYLVKPIHYSELSNYCTNLTGITNEMLDKQGTTLEYAIQRMMLEFKTKKYEFTSWGDYDRIQFQRECNNKNIEYPMNGTHINMKYILSSMLGIKVQRSVSGMLDFLHMKFEGNAHRGVDDAYNIARMYVEVMKMIRAFTTAKVANFEWGNNFHIENI